LRLFCASIYGSFVVGGILRVPSSCDACGCLSRLFRSDFCYSSAVIFSDSKAIFFLLHSISIDELMPRGVEVER
jgi:hypothetical protein